MDDMFHKKILGFVLARRHQTGGFAQAPSLPPSVEDTYLALRIVELLLPRVGDEASAVIRDPSLARFLLDPEEKEGWHAKTGFHYVYCCQASGMAPDGGWIKQFISDHLENSTGLEEHFYLARMVQLIKDPPLEKSLTFLKNPFPIRWRSAKELHMALVLVDGHLEKLRADRDALITWVRSCQNPDGGFGFLPGTTSYMENVHTCLRLLTLLKAEPPDHSGALRFILRAWTTSGGFARKNGGAPFLDATWHALASLFLLGR